VLNKFPIELLSSLSFILTKKTFTIGEDLIIEKDIGSDIFFISSGKVAIVHKRSKTFIKDLIKDEYFGEIGFFSSLHRQTSVRARDFTDVLTLNRNDFFEMAFKVSESSIL
jgi:CRP-like cAMP-binding protein